MIVFDIEADALLPNITKILCIVSTEVDASYDPIPGTVRVSTGIEDQKQHVEYMMNADLLCGHNIIKFDMAAIEKLLGFIFTAEMATNGIIDTMILSKLIFPDIWEYTNKHFDHTPPALKNRHSLESWGHRLKFYKGSYGKTEGAFTQLTPELVDYCTQDVMLTARLLKWIKSSAFGYTYSDNALRLENKIHWLTSKQEQFGIRFDADKARNLYGTLCNKREEVLRQVQQLVKPKRILEKEFVAKVNRKDIGYTKGQLVRKFKMVNFNPGSNDQVANLLTERYQWQPMELTTTGKPKMDTDVYNELKDLGYPEISLIVEYHILSKRISQLSDGDEGWLKHLKSDGYIYGSIDPLGTVTRRMSHSKPNLGQVPACKKPYGAECRELFMPPKDMVLVGCDAEQLELRTQGHLLYEYDHGAFTMAAVHGKKEDKTEIHWRNTLAFGLDNRDTGKTVYYAMVYGSGNEKLGRIITKTWDKENNILIGKRIKDRYMKSMPAFAMLMKNVKDTYASRGYYIDADAQQFRIRSDHSAFNAINQRLGALIMKRAQAIAYDSISSEFGKMAKDKWYFALIIHDEFQVACLPQWAQAIGKILANSITLAGEYYNIKCPLAGSYTIGQNWKETH